MGLEDASKLSDAEIESYGMFLSEEGNILLYAVLEQLMRKMI